MATARSSDAGRAEHRWPVLVALTIAMILYATLPSSYTPTLRYLGVGIGVVLAIPLIVQNPIRLHKEAPWSRLLSRILTFTLLVANQIALVQLVVQLLTENRSDGHTLLLATIQVWMTNVIVFAMLAWEFDRGGAVSRTQLPREKLPPADFRFPQDEDHDAVTEVADRSSVKSNWTPSYVDYLYSSLSNSMAFSPTDAMPLSHRAKLFMGLESFAGFVILALIIGRIVSLFG